MKKDRYVYKIFAGDDPLPFYIGVGKENSGREKYHFRKSTWGKSNPAKNAFIADSLASGVVFRFEYERGMTIDDAHAREIELISLFGRRDLGTGCLYNACRGGAGSKDMAPSVIARFRSRKVSIETRERISKSHIGMRHSEKAREKIKAARAKQIMPRGEDSPRTKSDDGVSADVLSRRHATRRYRARKRGEDVPILSRKGCAPTVSPEARKIAADKIRGTKRSDESRLKMSLSAKARERKGNPTPHTEEGKAKMREVKLGKTASDATRAKMRIAQSVRRAMESSSGTITHATGF